MELLTRGRGKSTDLDAKPGWASRAAKSLSMSIDIDINPHGHTDVFLAAFNGEP